MDYHARAIPPGFARELSEPTAGSLPADPDGTPMATAWNRYNDGAEKPLLTVSLPYEIARRAAAYHEAGHAVTAAYGAHIKVTGVTDAPNPNGDWILTGRTEFDGPPIPFWRFATQCAAGERSQTRYFKTAGLWSPETQAICANHDDFEFTRERLRQRGLTLTRDEDLPDDAYGMSWKTACRMADLLLSMLWHHVEAVAAGIDAHGILTGDQAAELAEATNPPRFLNTPTK
ncbi:hypothetical protein [Streptomyces sp. NPDC004230]